MTKILAFVALCVQLVATTAPARAASLEDGSRRAVAATGAFAGARVRLSLGGKSKERVRIGLAVAPMRASRGDDGRRVTRFGEGVEFGFSERRAPHLSFAGQPIGKRLGAAEDEKKEKGGGVPTWVIVGGGVVLALGIGAAVFVDALNDASE